MNKAEIDIVVGILKGVITLVEVVDPAAAQNRVVKEITYAISALQALGL